MARLTSNKLLPIAVGLVLLTLGGLAAKTVVSTSDPVPRPRTELPVVEEAPDGDTPVDTIRTLRAELTASNERLARVIEQNNDLIAANQELQDGEARLENKLTERLKTELAAVKSEQSTELQQSASLFSQELASLRQSLTVQPAAKAVEESALARNYPIANGAGTETNYVWVEPLDAEGTATNLAGGPGTGLGDLSFGAAGGNGPLLQRFDPVGSAEPIGDLASLQTGAQESEQPTPFFTINNLATLAGSTAFTAMIGRVPIDGQIADPVPFRVLVGRENLAASGLRVPDEIAAMVFEGVAIGDWTLGCVEGSLRTATFVFEDGTIRTVKGASGQDERLGYIADKFGTPCIAGERVSNAAGYLAAQVGLAAGAGAAEAYAAAQTAQVVEDGAIASAVIGDVAKFAVGRAASDATAEVQQYLANRLSNTFDAIYVPPGQEIALLIQQEIAIDYDPNGRKLNHAKGGVTPRRGLD
jgi:integrating conjugative element protein (TIGR03752 family)